LPPSTQGIVFSNSTNQSAQTYHSASKSNTSTGMVSFPFPGKQVSTLRVQEEKEKGWQDQFSQQLKLYQEQQQQLQDGNQLSIAAPEQYQGQTLWEGRFFV